MSFAYYKDVLPSGLRVITVETPHLHTAVVTAYVRLGSRHETPETNGVSHFLEHMFFRGSQAYPDSVRMNAAVEDVGGNLNGVTTRDHGYYYTPLHPAHLEVGVRILGDMLTRPLLPNAPDLEVERRIILEEMLDEVDEEGRDIELDNLSKMALFPAHALSLKIAGTPESVRALTHAQLREHLLRNYVAGNMVFTAAGRVRREEVLRLVEEAFSALPKGAPTTEEAPLPPARGPWLKFVRHDEAQTAFRMNFLAVPEHHEDHAALQILRRVLDDGLSSRLPFHVVEKRGLAYSIQAGLEAFHDVGVFEVEGASAPEKAAEVVTEVCRTLAEICEHGITADELLRAQRRHRMFLDFAEDSPGELAGWFGGTELFRTPESFEERSRQVEAQSAERVREVARKYLTRERLGVVAVGQKKGLRALEKAVQEAPLP